MKAFGQKRVFFDLDGTLIDISKRYYRVYNDFCRQNHLKSLSKRVYWAYKRNKVPDPLIWKDEKLARQFRKFFLKKIEKKEYLRYDRLFPKVSQVLKKLGSSTDVYIVTLRQNPSTLKWQIKRLGLDRNVVLISGKPRPVSSKNYLEKVRLLKPLVRPGNIIVGDSSADILAGKKLGLYTVTVNTGIVSSALLGRLQPDKHVRGVSTLLRFEKFCK